MFPLKLALSIIFSGLLGMVSSENSGFIYNDGFLHANLSLDGLAEFTDYGILMLTNPTRQRTGQAFFTTPFNFKTSPNSSVHSFSTYFVFAIKPQTKVVSDHGLAFVISPTMGLPEALPGSFPGLFNESNNGNATNHVVAVELGAVQSLAFNHIRDNHVGIDINGLLSNQLNPAGYYDKNNSELFHELDLLSGLPIQAWVDYGGAAKQMNVTLAPINVDKPERPLLSYVYDLSTILNQTMYVGFSSSVGSIPTSHYVFGWSFKMNGPAQQLNLNILPELPDIAPIDYAKPALSRIGLIIISVFSVFIVFVLTSTAVICHVVRKRKFAEELEDWELDYGTHRFKYKDLYVATKGFRDEGLLGKGGFGKVYQGVLPVSGIEIAVKKVSHESKQGIKEFVAEIVSIGRMRHRNLVSLLGYCRRRGELLLVYEYMPNSSLDKYIFSQLTHSTLSWNHRFGVIKGVASGLLYLHEEWEQVVIHRDVKASNVLLDGELNARLGDFGLARLYDHGSDPETTHVAGTFGYLAPEQTRGGKATTCTDVYAFGIFMLEVACGRRPIKLQAVTEEDSILVDWVTCFWEKGTILEAVDPKLGYDYVKEEVELVMKLGLLCSQSEPTARPTMRQNLLYLNGAVATPELCSLEMSTAGVTFANGEGFNDFAMSYQSSSITKSLTSEGR